MNIYEYKIMLVDDEPELQRMVKNFLVKEGFLHVALAGKFAGRQCRFMPVKNRI